MGDTVGPDPPDSTAGSDSRYSASASASDVDEHVKDISHLGNPIENKSVRTANSSNSLRSTGPFNHSPETGKRPAEGNGDIQQLQKSQTFSVSAMRKKAGQRYLDDQKILNQIVALDVDNKKLKTRVTVLEARNEYLESQLSIKNKLVAKFQEDFNQPEESREV